MKFVETELKGAFIIEPAIKSEKQFQGSLPFELTSAQNRVIAEIQNDLNRRFPMMRLVQGDVGPINARHRWQILR